MDFLSDIIANELRVNVEFVVKFLGKANINFLMSNTFW